MARVLAGTPPERTSRMMMLGAVLFAAIAALLVFVILRQTDEGGSSAAGTESVVVAATDVDTNVKLTADMLGVKAVPLDQVITGAYSSTTPLIGLPARYPIEAGDQITPGKVGVEAIQDEKDLSLLLKSGQRGFAVEATEVTAVGGLLLPGNFVDVIAVFGDETGGIEKAVTALQNIEVLGVAQVAQEPVPAAAVEDTAQTLDTQAGQGIRGQRPEDVERQPGARSVTLAVSPAQAQLLAALQAQDDVQIWLSLRGVDDRQNVPTGETNLLPFHSPPLPEP